MDLAVFGVAGGIGPRTGRGGRRDRSRGEDQNLTGEAVSVACHRRPAVFAALAAFHHHTIGNADAPYSGSLSGWENRSQRDARTLS